MDSTLESCSLVVYVDKGTSQNEDFACYNPPSVTLVSFGCCVLLAVSLTGCDGGWLEVLSHVFTVDIFLICKELVLPLFQSFQHPPRKLQLLEKKTS